ncbi:MAG TPA: helix-turn-helix domain-containing protein [Methylovirgula sp.]|nr:helix-turn-helix domain-containing protein [Methylovirgula sp.]
MTQSSDERVTDKRRRILEAAWALVLRQGLRGMTMEALAREAGIAKATLYAQFPDKDAVVAGVVDELLVALKAAYAAGIESEKAVAERIGAALASKYGVVARALEGSPHRDEIFNEHRRIAERFRAFDQGIESDVVSRLAQAGAPDANGLARTILAAAAGIARAMSDPAEIEKAIRLMARRMIAPEIRG